MLIKENILFSETECNKIISLDKTYPQNWELSDRKYNSFAINYHQDNKWIFDKLKIFFELETGLQITNIKNQIHFHKFIKNEWFGKHTDDRNSRMYAVGVLLNNDFEGGDFKLYNPDEYILNKSIGNTYIFDVQIEHEITPILNGQRYSLLWFLENKNIKVRTNKLI